MNKLFCPDSLQFTAAANPPCRIHCIQPQSLAKHGLMPQRPSLQISVRLSGDTTILDLTGEITLFNSPEFANSDAQLRDKRVPYLLLNMLGVPYVDSSGVASLVEGLRFLAISRRALRSTGLSKSARTVLELTHLLRIFEVHQTEAGSFGSTATSTV